MNITFKTNKNYYRYESNIQTGVDNGILKDTLIPKFIVHKHTETINGREEKCWVVKIWNPDSGYYEFTSWMDRHGTKKSLIEWLNDTCVNPENCTKWSIGWIEE